MSRFIKKRFNSFFKNNLPDITDDKLLKLIKNIYNQDPSNFLLIEIGANDGKMADRFHKFILENDPNCILVEPIPDYFTALRKNYQKNRNTKI